MYIHVYIYIYSCLEKGIRKEKERESLILKNDIANLLNKFIYFFLIYL